jgi:hypothetical protein
MYCWTLLSRDISATPYLMGVTDDLDMARKLCEPHLVARRAFLGYIQAVRPAMTAHGLDSCYVPVGRAWLGRARDSDGVGWREQELWADRDERDNPHA